MCIEGKGREYMLQARHTAQQHTHVKEGVVGRARRQVRQEEGHKATRRTNQSNCVKCQICGTNWQAGPHCRHRIEKCNGAVW